MTQYREPVNGVGVRELPDRLRAAIKAVQDLMPPNTGVIVFTFSFSEAERGMGYISNAERATAIESLKEWIALKENRK